MKSNGFKTLILIGITVLGISAGAAPSAVQVQATGQSALQNALQLIGTSTISGKTSGASEVCLLTFEPGKNGVLNGIPVLGTYALDVNGKRFEFYFTQATTQRSNHSGTRFLTVLHGSGDMDDEGRSTRGFTDSMNLDVGKTSRGIIVRINNGVQATCEFTQN